MAEPTGLTDAEREALAAWDNHDYSCACEPGPCVADPCQNDRDDLYTTVAHIKADAALAAAVQALHDAADALRHWNGVTRYEGSLSRNWTGFQAFLLERADRIEAGDE